VKLFLKVDHIAGLRTAGGAREPEPAVAASLAELEGVEGITIHLHQDRASVQLRDVQVLKETLSVPLNLELAPSTKNRQHAFDLRPDSVTLVQEPHDVRADRWPLNQDDREQVNTFVKSLREADIVPSMLVKPSIDAVRWAHRMNTEIIMIDTTAFTQAKTSHEQKKLFEKLSDCARLSRKLGMSVHIGGGIGYRNIAMLGQLKVDAIHVGYSIVARSVLVGIPKAVRDMMAALEKVR